VEAVTESSGLDAREILSTPDLIAAGVRGDDVRRRMHGARTTFVRVFEVHVEAPPAAAPAVMKAGEVRIIGRPASVESAIGAVQAAKTLAQGRVPVTGFSLGDLRALAPERADFSVLCRRLRDLGMVAIADTPLDAFLADPGAEEAVSLARDEGLDAFRLTVHAQPETGPDEADRRIAMVERARQLQATLGGFRAFAPLPRTLSIATPTTGYADVKQIALARVVVDNIPSIQVDWSLYGPKLAQVALTVGADDVDAVAALESGVLGARRTALEEIKNNIRAAALDPVERDANFVDVT
jgi:CofH/MqnC C-terminal region